MAPLTNSVRIAAASIFLLSIAHIAFWSYLGFSARMELPEAFPYNYVFPVVIAFSAGGLPGILIAIGLFRARHWARIAALALAALVAFLCAVAMAGILALAFGLLPGGTAPDLEIHRNGLLRILFVYLVILLTAIWWIVLFAKQGVAAQFSGKPPRTVQGSACPPPIALLAWLMIASGALGALTWPLIFGKIPAMLFSHIFSAQSSHWIWGVNTLVFLACGIGLLKLRRWSYTATIVLHIFWLASLFVTQLSPLYNRYVSLCLAALSAPDMFISLGADRLPQWVSALLSAIPTALLIVGLFYYRRSFVQAVEDSGR